MNDPAHNCCPDLQVEAEHQHAHASPVSEEAIEKAILSFDNLGIAASTLCLIHCMAMPFVIAFLPFLGLQFLEGHQSHIWLAGFIWTFALFAIVPGYLKHRKIGILIGMIVGLSFVSLAVFGANTLIGDRAELYSITLGNLILVGVHWKNRGLCKCCASH